MLLAAETTAALSAQEEAANNFNIIELRDQEIKKLHAKQKQAMDDLQKAKRETEVGDCSDCNVLALTNSPVAAGGDRRRTPQVQTRDTGGDIQEQVCD